MSDTPRTDAFYNRLDDYWQHDADFARTLERELNAAHDLLRQADDRIVDLERALTAVRDEVRNQRTIVDAATHKAETYERDWYAEKQRYGDLRAELVRKNAALEADNARLLALATEATSAT